MSLVTLSSVLNVVMAPIREVQQVTNILLFHFLLPSKECRRSSVTKQMNVIQR